MNKQPKTTKLSIVILNYNTRELLRMCLQSLPLKSDYQVIVVDNASSDDSVAMVAKEFPDVEIIQNSENLGYTKGNNAAKTYVLGELVLFLNSDTEVGKNTLQEMVKLMDGDQKIGISTCLTLLPNGQLYYACHRGFPTPWNSLCYFLGLAKIFPKVSLFSGYTATYLPLNKVHEIDACSGTFLLIRRPLLDEIDWFDEDYYSYGEDIEMCYQAKARGFKVVFNPNVKIVHFWGASSGLKSTSKLITTASSSNRERWNRARYDAMRIFYDKHYKDAYPNIFRLMILTGIKLAMFVRARSD